MGILSGINSDVWVSVSPSVALGAPESCTDSGDHIHYTASVHFAWDKRATFTVQNSPNGTTGWVTVTDYTVQWAYGGITFNTARVVSTNNFTRISVGNYFTVTQLDGCNKWSIALKGELIKTTPFQATGSWEVNTNTIKSWTGTVDAWRTDDRLIQEITAGNLVVVQLFINKTSNQRWQGYAMITDVMASSDSTAINTQQIKFATVNDLFYLLV